MSREPIPTWFFVLVVVRSGNRFLIVQERRHGQRWYVPAGRIEPGESIIQAAERETLEEAGIPIKVEGIIRFEHSTTAKGTARVRVVLLAHPTSNIEPKSVPDKESLVAKWANLEELSGISWRGDEVADLLTYVSNGPSIAPVGLLVEEGSPYFL